MLMKKLFQSKAVPRGTRTIWRYLGALFVLFTFAIGNVWAAYDVLFNGYSNTTKDNYYKSYTVGTKTVTVTTSQSISSSSGDYYVQLGSAASDASTNYISVVANEYIESVSFLMTGNGADKALIPALLCWNTAYDSSNKTYADSAIVHASQTVSAKGFSNAEWLDFDLSESSFKEVRVFKQAKNIVVKTAAKANFPASDAQTLQVYGVRIKLRSAAATYTVTVNPNGGSTSTEGWTLSEGSYVKSGIAKDASVTLPTMTKDDYTFAGWKDNHDNAITSPITITKDTTLVAQWASSAATQYNISYTNTKGATNTNPDTYYEGTGIASFDPLADVTDFHFTGWDPASISSEATGDQTITAQWVAAYNVTFSAGAGSGTVPASFQKWQGAKFNLPGQGSMTAPTGKAFDGWKANGAGDKLAADAEYTMGNAAVEFVAQWKTLPTVLFHYQWTGSSTQPAVGDVLNGTGGTMTVERKEGSTKTLSNESAAFKAGVPDDMKFTGSTSKGIKFGTSDVYFHIALTSGKFKEGDTIKICGYESFIVSSSNASSAGTGDISADLATGVDKDNYEVKWCVIPEVADCDLYVRRKGNSCGFAAIKVIRPAEREIISTTVELTGASINDVALTSSEFATLTTDPVYKFESASKYTTAPTIKFNKRTTITYDEGDPKVTNEVVSVVAEEVSSKWQAQATIGTTTYTITAVKPVSYTVTYYDGETEIGTEVVEKDASPVEYAAKQAKAHYDFVAWYNNADLAAEHEITDISALVISANTPVYGKWTPVYAESIDLEAEAGEESPTAINTFFANHKYTSEIGTKGGYDATGSTGYHGYKFKDDGDWIEFLLKSGDRAVITFGYCSKMTVNYGASSEEVVRKENSYADKIYANETANDMLVKITNTTSTSVINKIVIGEIPAASDDATLSDLTLKYGEEAAATISGFSASKFIYNIEVPYGTAKADLPIVGATATDVDHALVTINQAKDREDWKTVIRVQAEDRVDEHDKYYEVRFNVQPKLGVKVFEYTPAGSNGMEDATGYKGGKADINLQTSKTSGGYKLGSVNHYIGIAVDGGLKANDIVYIDIADLQGASALTFFDGKTENKTQVITPAPVPTVGSNYITVPADMDSLYLYRVDGTCNPSVKSVAVYRLMDPFIEEFKIGDAVGTINGTNIAVEVPYNADLEHLTPAIKYWANGNAQISPAVAEKDFSSAVEYTVSSSYAEDAPVTYTVTVTKAAHYVAQIGETKYTSLDDAVTYANANAGSEIVLLESITRDDRITLTANTTLNLNGYTFGKTNGGWLIFVKGGATLTIDGETASSAVYGGISLGASTNNNGSLVLNGGTYSCGENTACIHINGTCLNSNVTINGATITNAYDNAIQFNGKGVFTITDATITGATGIYIKSGEMTITNSTVTGTMAPANYSYNGNGANPTGDGIVVDACNYPGGAPTINIVSGTFSGTKSAIGNYNYQGTSEPAVGGITGGTFSTAVPAELCAEGYAPTSWTVGTETKYGVHLLGVIRAAAAQDANHGNAYAVTLDNGVVVISSNSDGKFDTNNQFDNSAADAAVALGADEGKYRYKGQHMLLKFPVNVNEFTIYSYDNNTTDRKINKVTVGDDPENVKLKNNDAIGTYTFTNNTTTKLRTMTATMTDDEIIASDKYVYVGLSNAHTVFRILYTEAPCIDPVINSIDATRMKVGEQATVSVDASAVGATYQWYRCSNAAGDNAAIITGATAASYSFTKAAGDEYFKVVVGCNCNDVKVEAVVKAEEWYEVIRTNVTGYTEWSWNGVYDNETAGPTINQAQKGLVLASYIDAPNFDKLEGNDGAYVYRKNQYPAFQGTQLKFTAEVPGMLIIDASYTDNGNTFSVNGYPMGTLPKNHAKDTIAVKAGDVTITSQGIRIWAMTFDPDFSNYALTDNKASGYTRDVTEGRYGTICLPNGGVMVGADIFEIAYYGETSQKIFFDQIPSGEMVAGTPYIFLPKEGATQLGVYYTDAADAPAGSYNGLIGSYTQEEITQNDGNYILLNNQYCYVDSKAYVGANRAYIKLSAINPTEPALAPGRIRMSMGVVGAPSVITGCENIDASEAPIKMIIDGQLFILRGEKMYDAQGRLVK